MKIANYNNMICVWARLIKVVYMTLQFVPTHLCHDSATLVPVAPAFNCKLHCFQFKNITIEVH